MLQGSLMGSTFRGGICRLRGSGSGRAFHLSPQIQSQAGPFSGLVKNPKIDSRFVSSIFENLRMKLGLVRVAKNVSMPCDLSFSRSIHSGEPKEIDEGRTPNPMDYLQDLRQQLGRGENERLPLNRERSSLRSMNNVQDLHQQTGNAMNERPQLYGEGGRALRPMDCIQGILNEDRGNALNGRPRLFQPQSEDERALRPTNHAQGVFHERGFRFAGVPQLYQPSHLESNADIVHIKLTRNNSFVTLTDSKGNIKTWISAALASGKGDKPNRYSAEAAAEYIGRKVRQMKTRSVVVKVSGHTFFRRKKDAILAFKDGYTNSRGDMNPIVHIEDTTRKPHNGCRLRKKRRI